MGVILLSGVIIMYCVCIDNTRLMVVSCGGDWLVLYCVEWMVLFELLVLLQPQCTHTAPPTSYCTIASVPFSHCFCLLSPPGTYRQAMLLWDPGRITNLITV